MTSVNVTSNPYSVTVDSTGTSVTIASVAASATSGTVTSVTPQGDNGSGTTITGSGNIKVAGTAPISTSVSGDTITVTHDNSGSTGVGKSYPSSITVDSFGHVTGTGTSTTPVLPSNNLSDLAAAGTSLTNLGGTTVGKAVFVAANAAAARVVLGVTNVGSYTGQIETAADKTYTLDPGAATARTITGFFIKSASGTVTATLKVGTAVVKAASVTSSTGDQTSLANTSVSADDVLTLVTSSNSSALDVIFAVEFTQ